MAITIREAVKVGSYILGKRIKGEKRYPLVLMLEPLFRCNLACAGCGRIQYPADILKKHLSPEECFEAAEECGAPIVSICGGEPTIYPDLPRLLRELRARRKHVYLCTHGMFIRKRMHEWEPSSSFFINVHLDGLEQTHDLCVEREGVFREAIEGIKAAKAAGFLVCTNTTIYKQTDLAEIADLYELLDSLGVDGYMITPAYSYAAVQSRDIFMSRDEIRWKFRKATALLGRHNLMTSPIYLEFLRGDREMTCTAWGNPTYNPRGWKGPCYLMTDAHHATFAEFMEKTPWEKYGRGRDPRCEDCMVHVGYEPSAVLGANRKLGDSWKLLTWQLTGRSGLPAPAESLSQ